MRIEIRIEMLFGHLVIGNLQLSNWQIAINNWLLAVGNRKKTIYNVQLVIRQLVIGQTKVSVLFLDKVEFLDRVKFLDRVECLDRLECLVRQENLTD